MGARRVARTFEQDAYNARVTGTTPGLVDIVRDFLVVDQAMRSLFERFRSGALSFEEVRDRISADEGSALFRLKERCHSLFRADADAPQAARPREVLFDLAVGSLFHETMKFRENFYQREIYGPRVRALRDAAGEEATALFLEFEKILATVSENLEQGLSESEALLTRTREQLAVLLTEEPEDGRVVRYLIEHRDAVEAVFCEDLDALLARVYGDTAAGFAQAGRSYLESGYFEEADRMLAEAVARGGECKALEPLGLYARGMAAYMKGNYTESVAQLERWIDGEEPREAAQIELACAAISKIDQLAQGGDHEPAIPAAASLLERLSGLRPGSGPAGKGAQ
jgi:tetratricopeptide (TPR) repeat protein